MPKLGILPHLLQWGISLTHTQLTLTGEVAENPILLISFLSLADEFGHDNDGLQFFDPHVLLSFSQLTLAEIVTWPSLYLLKAFSCQLVFALVTLLFRFSRHFISGGGLSENSLVIFCSKLDLSSCHCYPVASNLTLATDEKRVSTSC
ncbi:hypothetical protein SynBIOSE41_02572 [Synechococcus sp. BIOS-E4-1]|nr:hypothetical protein SynBIOSE41_02572 [Synechococcus sp. BIOS-E4-1]